MLGATGLSAFAPTETSAGLSIASDAQTATSAKATRVDLNFDILVSWWLIGRIDLTRLIGPIMVMEQAPGFVCAEWDAAD